VGTRERYALLGVEPISSTPEEYSRYIAAEIAKWEKMVKQAGLAPAS
jgi:tripartite-type tricarboxylate transporter receptor subunit TctC